ncbi:MAG: hypothetical protein ACREHD_25115 [Pirellulales bacterium]
MPHRQLTNGKIAALRLLKDAYDDAAETNRNVKQFAISGNRLLLAGATESDLRWPLAQRFAEQLLELRREGQHEPSFRAVTGLQLAADGSFVLTYAGKVFAERLETDKPRSSRAGPTPSTLAREEALLHAPKRIFWNKLRHELWVDDKLAKRYFHAAPVQWPALDKFEEDGWKGPISLDLTNDSDRDQAQRLREIVKELNHGLDQSLIRFRKDSSGSNLICFDLNGASFGG